jgi:spore germination protein GerM
MSARAESSSVGGLQPNRPTDDGGRHRRILIFVAVGVVLALVAAGVVLLVTRDDGTTQKVASPPSTAVTTTPAPAAPETDTSTAVWPAASSATRYATPAAAAKGFATDFLGFVDPVVGTFRAGDSRSGEVPIRPSATGPETTVLVRELGPQGSWWVLGASTANIQVTAPAALDSISSPVAVRGTSTAFEGTVAVEVREDGARHPLGTGYVTGGANGQMGPFDGSLTFSQPAATAGAIVFSTRSSADGTITEATVLRVNLAGVDPANRLSTCRSNPAAPDPGSGQTNVFVYFTCGDASEPVAGVVRHVAATTPTVRTALEQLLAGPTRVERDAGFRSWFSDETAGALAGVQLQPDGSLIVDFHDLRTLIPNASSSAGSTMLLRQLDATVFHVPEVHSATYRIEGDCNAFGEWLQVNGCTPRVNPG